MNHAILSRPDTKMQRYALYARFSSILQNPRSVDDQLQLCRQRIEEIGASVTAEFSDAAATGATMHGRPGLQALMALASKGLVDIVCAEALDRISRSQADMARIFEQLQFNGVQLITLEEGEITAMHIGVKGMMNQAVRETLAAKTVRGQIACVHDGRASGGLGYGYVIANRIGADGQAIRGLRAIEPGQAEIVRRIFRLYADGLSPRRIAVLLNDEGIPGPRGGAWTAGGINGNRNRGAGILHNELYHGVRVFRRRRYVTNPATGKRQARFLPSSEWTVREEPALRIVDETLWNQVQNLSRAGQDRRRDPGATRAPLPLSHLTACGWCGGRMAVVNQRRYGCIRRRESGTCDMSRRIAVDELEKQALLRLREWVGTNLDWRAALAEAATAIAARRAHLKAEIEELRLRIANLLEAIELGGAAVSLNRRLVKLEQDLAGAELERDTLTPPPATAPADLAERLLGRLAAMSQALAADRASATHRETLLRLSGLIERITVTPADQPRAMEVAVVPRIEAMIALALDGGDARRPGKRAAVTSR